MNLVDINNKQFKIVHYIYEPILINSMLYIYEDKYLNLNPYNNILYYNDIIDYINKLKVLNFIQKEDSGISTCIGRLEYLLDRLFTIIKDNNFIQCKDIVEYFTPIQIKYERII